MLKILSLIIIFASSSSVFAQDGAASPQGGFTSFIPLILIFVIFYFLLIRPQQKKAKVHQAMVNDLKIGNDVCTSSGIFGKIKKIDDKENIVDLEISKDVVVRILKASVNQVLDSKKLAKSKITKTAKLKK
jgi:preprotein translocase subunit YajC